MRTSHTPTGVPASVSDPASVFRPRRRTRPVALPHRAPGRRRLRGWAGRIGTVLGVIAGLGLIASAVLLGVPAGAEEAGPGSVVAPAPGYRWPLDGTPTVTRPFDPPPQPWAAGHRGVDLAAADGAVVRAAGPGVVHFAGSVAGRGVVSIQHANGLRTTYEPVTPSVTEGQRVRAGDPIGELVVGHRGCPAPACLHWGLRHGGTYLDPLSLLGLGRVRLLPLRRTGH